MKLLFKIAVAILVVAIAVVVKINSFAKAPSSLSTQQSFAVVELFTSEGCSSCPPADKLVTQLALESEKNKTNIIFLNFHVSYWDYIGWKDIYGDKKYAERQDYYSEYFPGGKSYTPQMIVNGSTEFVGSNETQARKTIDAALAVKKENLFKSLNAKTDSNSVAITYSLSQLPKNAVIQFALVEKNIPPSKINKGENKGKTLQHYSVVRRFETIDNKDLAGKYKINYSLKTKSKNFIVIVFVQNKETRQIISAEQIALN